MKYNRLYSHLVAVFACLLVMTVLNAGTASAQVPVETGANMPQIVPDPEQKYDQTLEFGGAFGRYKFDTSGEKSTYDSQFVRYSRSRPSVDWWRVDAGRQGRFGDNSLDLGLTYTRFMGATGLSAGVSSGTSKNIANKYLFALGVSHPFAGFLTRLDYVRAQSHGENHSDSWGLGVTRWLSHWIVGGSYKLDFGHPGDTEASSYNFGVTYYQWRKIYVGAGVQAGGVSYQLLAPGMPLSSGVLVDYDAWSTYFVVTAFVGARSGVTARYDHSRAEDNWNIDGFTCSYFREW